MTKYYRDSNNKFLGGFDEPPAGGIEVNVAPSHANATWHGTGWSEPSLNLPIKKEKFKKYLKDNNKWKFAKRLIKSMPSYLDDWEAKEIIDKDDQLLRAIAKGLNKTDDEVLASANATDMTPTEMNSFELLEDAKDQAKALVTAERDRRKALEITYNGNQFSVSEWDITMITSLLSESRWNNPLPTGDYWRTANNVNVNLSKNDLENLNDLIRAQIQAAYAWSWAKKGQIEACTTVEQVNAIDLEIVAE